MTDRAERLGKRLKITELVLNEHITRINLKSKFALGAVTSVTDIGSKRILCCSLLSGIPSRLEGNHAIFTGRQPDFLTRTDSATSY